VSGADEDELDENEESDRIRFKEALSIIGALGREAPPHSLNVMTQLLEGSISRFGLLSEITRKFFIAYLLFLGFTITFNE